MSDIEPHQTRSRRRTLLWVPLLILFLAVAVTQVSRSHLRGQVLRQLESLRSEGYPTEARDLQNWRPPLLDKENAALRIMEAADSLAQPANSYNPDKWPGRAEELGPGERDQLKELLTDNGAALEAVHLAAQIKESRFPIDYSRGPATLLPHLAKIKSLTQLLKAEAMIACEEGQTDKAVRSVIDGAALARSLDAEPILISQLVRIACLSITCSSLERVLTQQKLSEPHLTRLAAAFHEAREASAANAEGALVGEVCLGIYCFRVPPKELSSLLDGSSESSQIINAVYPLYAWTGLRHRDHLFFLKTMREMLLSTKLPFPDRLARTREIEASAGKTVQTDKLLLFSRMLLPSLPRATDKLAEAEGRMRCAETALAVEKFRVREAGRLPSALTECGAEATDPFDGNPLRYRKLNPGYVVYSVGPDQTDDGGSERANRANSGARIWPLSADKENGSNRGQLGKGRSGSYDIVFAVER